MIASKFDGRNIYRIFFPGLLLIFFGFILQRCTYTLEKPPQQKSINLITPVNHLVTVNTSQSFSWGAVAGTTYYQLQLASPDFTSGHLVADTSLKGPLYSGVLAPGRYEWCVQAVNSSSVTLYSDTNSFTVH